MSFINLVIMKNNDPIKKFITNVKIENLKTEENTTN